MVLVVGDIDPAIGVGDDIMHNIELAGVGARRAQLLISLPSGVNL